LTGDNVRAVLKDLSDPWSHAWKRQKTLWKLRNPRAENMVRAFRRRRKESRIGIGPFLRQRRQLQNQFSSKSLDKYSQRLFWWSALSTLTGGLSLTLVIAWVLRDAGWSWQAPLVEAWQKLSHSSSDSLPWIDSLRAPSYRIGDWRANWPAELVGFSYVPAGAKYYQGLFSGLMPLLGRQDGRSGWRALAAEIFMRVETVTAPVLVSWTIIVDAHLWPIATAIGQTIVVFCNVAVWSFATWSVKQAQTNGISTAGAPKTRIHGLDSLWEWVPSSFFYACVVWVIGSLIFIGVLHDVAVYAIAVASTNIFLFYIVKCGKGGRDVRIGLARGCIVAERLRIKRLTTKAGAAQAVVHDDREPEPTAAVLSQTASP
jgi:hypothetical protein